MAWLLGIHFAIQVVPAGGDRILHVLAGQAAAVGAQGRASYEAVWNRRVPRQARLVIATIEGGPAQQTWQNVGRALAAAAPLVEDDGVIALCCDLADAPGPAVRFLAGRSREEALHKIRKHRPSDFFSAMQLARTQERSRVYLLSRLDHELLDQLDIAPINGNDELARLVRQFDSCIVLANAPHVCVALDGGPPPGVNND